MQATKDSFYVTLRDRLAQANPGRTIKVDGITRPAILVRENDKTGAAAQQQDAYYLEWGDARAVRPAISTLMSMTCTVTYSSAGTEQNGGLDRGHILGSLESDLLGMCAPAATQKNDYSSGAPVYLASHIFWSQPTFGPADAGPGSVARAATITVYFYPEVNQA